MKLLRAGPFKGGCKAAPFERTIPKKKTAGTVYVCGKPLMSTGGVVLSIGAKSPISRCLTNIVHRRRPGVVRAVDDSTPGDPNLEGHAAPAVVHPQVRFASGSSYGHYPCDGCQLNIVAPAATTLPICSAATYPLGHFLAPTCARLFPPERDGRSYHCCSPTRTRLCGIPPRDNWRDKHRRHQQQRCR